MPECEISWFAWVQFALSGLYCVHKKVRLMNSNSLLLEFIAEIQRAPPEKVKRKKEILNYKKQRKIYVVVVLVDSLLLLFVQ